MSKKGDEVRDEAETSDINRRTVLSGIGAVGTSVGLIGTAERVSADSAERDAELQALAGKYETKSAVMAATKEFASPVITKLFRDGYLDTRSVDELVTEPNTGNSTHVEALAGVTDNRAIIAIKPSDSVTIQVEPEQEVATAFVKIGDTTKILDTRTLTSDRDGEMGTLSYSDCCATYTDCVLSGGPNESSASLYDIYCCGSTCTDCQYEYAGGCAVDYARDPPVCQSDTC